MNSIQRIIIAALLITTAGITTATVSGTAVAESESAIHWTGAGATGPTITQDLQVEAFDEPISFGADTGRSLRIKNTDTGEAITLTPTATTTYEVTQFGVNFYDLTDNLGDGEYKKADEPDMTIDTNEIGTISSYPLKIEGDPTAFYDKTFYNYKVQLLDGSETVIAQTSEPRPRAAGYNVSYEYNGSALAVTRDPAVKSDWHVQLVEGEKIATADNTAGDDYFVFDVGDVDFSPNESFSVRIYPDETRTTVEYEIVSLYTIGGFDDAGSDPKLTIVDGPVGDTDDSSSPPEESPSEDGSIGSAERTIDSPKAVAGETVGVTVTASFDGTVSTAEITDTISFKPDSSNVTITEADGATVSSYQPSSGNIFASWGSTTEETLSYEVTIPADASSGTTFTFSGEVSDGETTVSTTGDSTIEVVTDPLVSYAGSDDTVGPSGLGDAAADFRAGEIGPGTLGEVAAAFRSGEPVV